MLSPFRWFAIPLIALLCHGCSSKKEEPAEEISTSLPAVQDVAVVVATEGERDPIADESAIRGGVLNTWGGPYPKSLNYWVDPNSFSGNVMGLMFESLAGLHPTEDRLIGGLAESWEISEDGMTFTFKLRSEAKWSDGKAITASDVQFYYDTIMDPKNLTTVFRVGMSRFERPEVIDDRTIRATAKKQHWSNLSEVAGWMAFPQHAWQGKNFNEISFDFPVVSGPYSLSEVRTNRFILLKRRGDWWGRVLPFNVGKFNFDYIRYRAMEDRNKALEALKKEDFDLYPIYTALIWAKQTDFPQVQKGWVVRQEILNSEPKGFQGLAMNLRRPQFQDPKVRRALAHLLNREMMNDKLMFHQYFLLNSYYPDLFEGNQNPEAPLLPYDPKAARSLLAEAGYTANAQGRLEKDGQLLKIVILNHQDDNRHMTIYLEDLKAVGIEASIDQLTYASYAKRIDEYDYDMTWLAFGAGRDRDPEPMWLSTQAKEPSSLNIPGVEDPKIDALIEQQKTELNLSKRNEILRGIDDRLTEIMPYVLLWQSDRTKLLYWNKFGMPKNPLGKFGREDAAVAYWWFDPAKESALREAMKNNSDLPKPPAIVTFSDE